MLHDQFSDALSIVAAEMEGERPVDQEDLADNDELKDLLPTGEIGTEKIANISIENAKLSLGAVDGVLPGMKATFDPFGRGEARPLRLFWHQYVFVVDALRRMFPADNEQIVRGVVIADDVGLGKTSSVLATLAILQAELATQRKQIEVANSSGTPKAISRNIPLLST